MGHGGPVGRARKHADWSPLPSSDGEIWTGGAGAEGEENVAGRVETVNYSGEGSSRGLWRGGVTRDGYGEVCPSPWKPRGFQPAFLVDKDAIESEG